MKFHAAVLAVLVLSACSKKEAETPAAKGEAPPPAPATVAPAETGPALTPEGWGEVKIGMTEKEALAVLGPVVKDDTPHDEDWLACHAIRPVTPEGVWIMVEEDRITRVSIHDAKAGLKTDKRIGVGDAPEAVKAAYPAGLKAEPHKYEDPPAQYLTWWEGPERGVRYTVGHDGKIAEISVGASIELVEGCS